MSLNSVFGKGLRELRCVLPFYHVTPSLMQARWIIRRAPSVS